MTSELGPGQRSDGRGHDSRQYPFESFEGTARYLGIPQENWGHPTVREFVGLLNRVHQLQHDLSQADVDNSYLKVIKRGAQIDPVQEERYWEANRGLNPTLTERYDSTELLMRVALQILQEGFKGRVAHPDYIKGKLNAAIVGYGLKVVPVSPPTTSETE